MLAPTVVRHSLLTAVAALAVVGVGASPAHSTPAGPAMALLASAPASMADLTADEILDRALEHGAIGFSKGTATLRMIITDEKGRVKDRTIAVKAMKGDDGLLRTMMKFERPAEVAGMGFLVVQKADELPDQFVYMPAARVVRRIPSGSSSGSLFGSDFAYVDLMPLPAAERERATFTRLPDERVGSRDTFVVQTDINVPGAPYSRLVTYVDQKLQIPLRIVFFDGDEKKLKTLKVKQLQKIDGRIIPVELEMSTEKGTSTLVQLGTINSQAPLTTSDFTEEALQR